MNLEQKLEVVDGHSLLRTDPDAAYRLLAEMDAHGISRSLVAGNVGVSADQLAFHIAEGGGVNVDVDHELLLRQCEAQPTRLIPAYLPNPYRDDACRLYEEEGALFHALKIAPAIHGLALQDPRVVGLIEASQDFQHPVLIHCLHRKGYEVSELVELSLRFPRTQFVLEDSGVGHGDFHGLTLIRDYPNISFETSGGVGLLVKEACKRLGSQRVIFGSKYPVQYIRAELVKMECLGLNAADLAAVMGGNLLRLMERVRHAQAA